MPYRDETEEEHRGRDARAWEGLALLTWLFPGTRWIWLPLLILVGGVWTINIVGESGVWNSQEAYYSGIDARTGKPVVVQGCRPERLLPDGSCDRSITLETVRKAFPHWGPPKKVPSSTSAS